MVTFEEIRKNPGINTYIRKADESLVALGYTEHSFAHVGLVAEECGYILQTLGYPEREVELAKIAAYGVNTCKIESCPVSGRNFEFIFFFDLDASVREPGVLPMLEELERISESFTFLGNYAVV